MDGTSVLVFKLAFADGTGHGEVRVPVRIVRLEVYRFKLLKFGMGFRSTII